MRSTYREVLQKPHCATPRTFTGQSRDVWAALCQVGDRRCRQTTRQNPASFQANLLLTTCILRTTLACIPVGQTMADQDPAAPWTIKAVPVHIREKAVRYARMDGCTMAEWL